MKKKKIEKAFLPVSKDEMVERGWYYYDFLVVTADAYVDHPSFGTSIIARVLEAEGYRVAVLAQPDWHSADAFRAMGRPRYGVMIGGGNIDSMVAHYTAAKKRRTQDLYSPGSRMGLRPDRPTIVYANRCREAFLLSKPIRAYQLGEVYAQNMGVPLRAFRTALILLSSVLSACVTAFAGPISFVGIAVPHLMKSLFKSAEPLCMIPACFLGGGVFCLFCDLIARTAFAPTEVSISSVTAVFGAPIVIYMMIHRKAA